MELFGEEEKGRGIEKRRREVRLLFQRRSILLSLINGEKKKKEFDQYNWWSCVDVRCRK